MKISIIIATYNSGKTLNRCLDSIVKQLTDDCELIIVDGGSTDNTNAIISSYKKYVAYTVSEKDKGVYDAWNKGVMASKGEWIAFIGSDDILLPTAINNYIQVIEKTPNVKQFDYICAHNEYADSFGNIIQVIGAEPKWNVMRKRMSAAHVGSLHSRKNLFDTIGLYDFEHYKICADYELLMRKKDKLKYMMLPCTIARMQTGGLSFSIRAIKEAFRIREKHQSVPAWLNYLLYMCDVFLFKTYNLRHFHRKNKNTYRNKSKGELK